MAPQRFADLSEPMQAALAKAAGPGIPVDDPRRVGVQPVTLEALERHGLLHQRQTRKGGREWRPTDRGRGMLVAHEPKFLAKGVGYTWRPSSALAVRGPGGAWEPEEAVDDDALAGFARSAQDVAHERFAELLEQRRRLQPEERLRLARRDAARRRVDVDRQLRVIVRRIDEIEARLYAAPKPTL